MAGGTLKMPDPLQMAREVPAKRPVSPLAQIAKAAEEAETDQPETPLDSPVAPENSNATMAYLMIGLALLLLVIGSWAVGALMYMRNYQPLSPRDVAYPFISWHIDLRTGGNYARSSVAMAWSMLLCIPVGMILLWMGWRLRAKNRPQT